MKRESFVYKTTIALVILASFWPLTFFTKSMRWDIMDIALPWRHYVSEAITNSILPLWNPFMNTGFPQYGDPSTWYWPTWLLSFLFGYDLFIIQLEFVLHLLLGAIGMYSFMRYKGVSARPSLVGGCSLMMSGFVVANSQHLGWIIGAAYFPWAFLLTLKLIHKPTWLNGITWALIWSLMLSGSYPGMVVVSAYTIALFGLFELWKLHKSGSKPLLAWKVYLLAITVFLILAAVTLVSSFDLAQQVNRGGPLPLDGGQWSVLFGSLSPQAILTLLIPYASTINADFWGMDLSLINTYFGFIPVFFIMLGLFHWKKIDWNFKLSFFVLLFFLMTAMAETFPFRKAMYYVLPFMDLFRFSTFIRLYAIFFGLLSFGFAWDYIMKLENREAVLKRAVIAALGVLLVFLAIGFTQIEPWKFKQLFTMGFERFETVSLLAERAYVNLLLAFGFMLLFALIVSKRLTHQLIVFLCLLDMALAVQLNGNATIWNDANPQHVQQKLKQMPDGYPIPDINVSVASQNDISGNTIGYLWKNLSVFHKLPSADGSSPYGMKTADKSVELGLFDAVIQEPIVFLSDIDAGRIRTENNTTEGLVIEGFNPNVIEVKATLSEAKTLVFVQNTSPWWRVYVDGKEASYQVVNETFGSVSLSRGEHQVRFQFEPKWVIISFWISGIGVLLAIGLLMYQRIANLIRD